MSRRQVDGQRLAVVSVLSSPRTPYANALEKLWPTEVASAVKLSLGLRPMLLVTLQEVGAQDPQLIRQEWPL